MVWMYLDCNSARKLSIFWVALNNPLFIWAVRKSVRLLTRSFHFARCLSRDKKSWRSLEAFRVNAFLYSICKKIEDPLEPQL